MSLSDQSRLTPNVPDAPPVTEQFLPVVYVDGRQWGNRDEIDACSSLGRAIELGETFARNIGSHMGEIRVVILRREVGPWLEDHAMTRGSSS